MGNGTRQDLLLVTTSPRFDDAIHQSVLWAFEAYGKHPLVFAVSLGQGASGYAPNLDCQDGIIAVGRLISSVLLIDAEKAKKGWENWIAYGDERGRGISALGGEWGMVMDPRGVNVQAIVQPFYLTDPEGSLAPTNWGVALVPNLNPSGPLSELDVSVGTTAPGVMWSSTQPLSGFPTYQYTYQPGVDQNPRPPFEADPAHGGANQHLWPGVVKKPALVGTTPMVGFPGKKQAVWTNANVKDASGTIRQTNLVVGVSSMSPLASASGNSLVVMEEAEPSKTAQVGVWPDPGQPGGKEESPFGKGVAYEIAHQVPQIDPLTGYCAVQVYNRSQGGSAWFIVDLNTPSSPRTLAKLDGEWAWGCMSGGVFYGDMTGDAENRKLTQIRLTNVYGDILGVCAGSLQKLIDAQNRARNSKKFQREPDGTTHCNAAMAWIANEMGAPMGPLMGRGGIPDNPGINANQQAINLAKSEKYREVSAEEAQRLADDGDLVIGAWDNTTRPSRDGSFHGHVVTVRPEGVNGDDPLVGKGPLVNDIGRNDDVSSENWAFPLKDSTVNVHFYTLR